MADADTGGATPRDTVPDRTLLVMKGLRRFGWRSWMWCDGGRVGRQQASPPRAEAQRHVHAPTNTWESPATSANVVGNASSGDVSSLATAWITMNRRRSVRVPIAVQRISVDVKAEGRSWTPAVIDLSMGGILVEFPPKKTPDLENGTALQVRLWFERHLVTLTTKVKRRDGRRYGVAFLSSASGNEISFKPDPLRALVAGLSSGGLRRESGDALGRVGTYGTRQALDSRSSLSSKDGRGDRASDSPTAGSGIVHTKRNSSFREAGSTRSPVATTPVRSNSAFGLPRTGATSLCRTSSTGQAGSSRSSSTMRSPTGFSSRRRTDRWRQRGQQQSWSGNRSPAGAR